MSDHIGIEKMISELNGCIPVNRRSLSDYIENGDLTYRTRGDVSVSFDDSELKALDALSTGIEKMRIRLPIMIAADASGESGVWKVEGVSEVSVISKMLGKRVLNESSLRLYYPDIKDLRKILPNLAIMVFIP